MNSKGYATNEATAPTTSDADTVSTVDGYQYLLYDAFI